jgi:hypothetical protein
VLLVERGTELSRLSCRVCHSQIRAGERVLVSYRRGKPSVIHAHLCKTPLYEAADQPTR